VEEVSCRVDGVGDRDQHVHLLVADRERAAAFYEAAFGWTVSRVRDEMLFVGPPDLFGDGS
jgi:catechol-2,3-dioxygenase